MSIAMEAHMKRGLENKAISREFKAGLVIYRSNKIALYPSEEEIAGYLGGIITQEDTKKALDTLLDWDIAAIHGIREKEDSRILEYEIHPSKLNTFKELDSIANSMSLGNE